MFLVRRPKQVVLNLFFYWVTLIGTVHPSGSIFARTGGPPKENRRIANRLKTEKVRLVDQRILFVGNSYTYYAKLPRFFQAMAAHDGRRPLIEACTGPGLFLADHLSDPKTIETIEGGSWDIVILQGQSLSTLESRSKFMSAGRALVARAKKAGARVYLFETWARRDGHEYYQRSSLNKPVNTRGTFKTHESKKTIGPKEMQQAISTAYADLAKVSGAQVLHVGQAMTLAATQPPLIRVFDDDGSHPSLLGAQLGAMVMVAELAKQCPRIDLPSSTGVEGRMQKRLMRIVAQVTGIRCHF